MLQGRPLYDTEADHRYFVVPTEWDPLMRAIARRNNILLTGSRGSGKTTFLRQVQYAMRKDDEPVAYVDANAVDSTIELATRVREGLRGRPPMTEALRTRVRTAAYVAGGDPSPPPGGASRQLLHELEAVGEESETTILVDASGAAGAVYGLFGRLRDTLWQMPHRWVVAVDEDERLVALKPPADAFFDTVLRLQPYSTEALIELLHRRNVPTELDEEAIRDIASNADGNARAALRTVNDILVSGRPPSEALSERGDLISAAAALGRPHGMLMAELIDLGQASPSDDALQQRLGLTRGRITALLRQLLDAGLVETGSDRPAGPGRPKTIYRPKLRNAE